jgi:hypothetical protein
MLAAFDLSSPYSEQSEEAIRLGQAHGLAKAQGSAEGYRLCFDPARTLSAPVPHALVLGSLNVFRVPPIVFGVPPPIAG